MLASGGLGLTTTLIFSDHITGNELQRFAQIWLFISAVTFALSAFFCLCVYSADRKLVIQLVGEHEDKFEVSKRAGFVRRIHQASLFFFAAGMFFTCLALIAWLWIERFKNG